MNAKAPSESKDPAPAVVDRPAADPISGYSLRLERIGKLGILMAVLTVLGQLTGLVREAAIAYFLGATGRTDTFIAAYQPIEVLTSAILLSMSFGILPLILEYRRDFGQAVAVQMTRRLQYGTAGSFVGVCALLYLGGVWILHQSDPHLGPLQVHQALRLWHGMVPAVALASLTAFFSAELIAAERFVYPGLNSFFLNCSIVLCGVIGWKVFGIEAFALGVTLGFLMQLLVQALATNSERRRADLKPERQIPRVWRDGLRFVAPVFVVFSLSCMSAIVPRRVASALGEGQMSVLAYATRAVTAVYLLGSFAISYPYSSFLARAVASGEAEQARSLFRSLVRSAFLFSLPAIAALALLRAPLVRVLFQRGAFTPDASAAVTSILPYLSPLILGALVSDVIGRCLIATKRIFSACILYSILVALSWILSQGCQSFWGLKGTAAGWSLASCLSGLLFLVGLARQMGGRAFRGITSSIGRILLAGLLSCAVMAVSSRLFLAWRPGAFASDITEIVVTLAAGGTAFIGSGLHLGIPELVSMIDSLKGKLGIYERPSV